MTIISVKVKGCAGLPSSTAPMHVGNISSIARNTPCELNYMEHIYDIIYGSYVN